MGDDSLNRLRWFGHVQRMEENRIPWRVLYMNLGTITLRGRPRNRWQDGVREDRRIVGGEGWQEKVHNGEEWKKLLRTARNRHILHVPMEWIMWDRNKWINTLYWCICEPSKEHWTFIYIMNEYLPLLYTSLCLLKGTKQLICPNKADW